MTTYPTYPNDLYEIIKTSWGKKRYEDDTIPILPNKEIVQNIIDVVYHASFLTEERRRLWFRVIYLNPEYLDKISPQHKLIKFEQYRDFNAGELVKLVPAANPTQVLIGIFKKHENSNDLIIWGLIEAGISWWRFLRYEGGGGYSPPNGFTISSKQPGQINISRAGFVLLSLKEGKAYQPSDRIFYNGPVAEFLQKGAHELYKETCQELGSKVWDEEGMDDNWPQRFYLFFIQRILNRIRETYHGGTLIIIPDEIKPNDTRITDRLFIKYPCQYEESWKYLIDELVRHKKYYKLHFGLGKKEHITNEEYSESSRLRYYEEENENRISSAVGFLSSLSRVDGAVVITDKLKLLGFGAEITAPSPTLKKVRIITDTEEKGEYTNIDLFGTRHRSALRFCSSFENCVVFIVSQDGDIKAAKRVGSEVMLWPEINVRAMGF